MWQLAGAGARSCPRRGSVEQESNARSKTEVVASLGFSFCAVGFTSATYAIELGTADAHWLTHLRVRLALTGPVEAVRPCTRRPRRGGPVVVGGPVTATPRHLTAACRERRAMRSRVVQLRSVAEGVREGRTPLLAPALAAAATARAPLLLDADDRAQRPSASTNEWRGTRPPPPVPAACVTPHARSSGSRAYRGVVVRRGRQGGVVRREQERRARVGRRAGAAVGAVPRRRPRSRGRGCHGRGERLIVAPISAAVSLAHGGRLSQLARGVGHRRARRQRRQHCGRGARTAATQSTPSAAPPPVPGGGASPPPAVPRVAGGGGVPPARALGAAASSTSAASALVIAPPHLASAAAARRRRRRRLRRVAGESSAAAAAARRWSGTSSSSSTLRLRLCLRFAPPPPCAPTPPAPPPRRRRRRRLARAAAAAARAALLHGDRQRAPRRRGGRRPSRAPLAQSDGVLDSGCGQRWPPSHEGGASGAGRRAGRRAARATRRRARRAVRAAPRRPAAARRPRRGGVCRRHPPLQEVDQAAGARRTASQRLEHGRPGAAEAMRGADALGEPASSARRPAEGSDVRHRVEEPAGSALP